ncbi:MAG: TraB/GumN family protein [Thermoplasmata archaeon]|nr:MAG: TraB/GumN family protein [Thermoplasmata archaeon]
MITLLGVGHVFDIKHNVEDLIITRQPNLVCVELDKARYQALVSRTPNENAPLIYALLAKFQENIAGKYEVKVGEEMLAAVESAKKIGASLAFIDVEASQAFANIWRKMSLKERMKLLIGAIGGLFVRKKRIEKELKNFEKNSEEYMKAFGQSFPTIKRELVDNRDKYMAGRIREYAKRFTRIVVVIGDGHIIGIKKALADLNPEVIRLKDLRAMKLSKKPGAAIEPKKTETSEVGFSYLYKGD